MELTLSFLTESGDLDLMLQNAVSDQGLHSLSLRPRKQEFVQGDRSEKI